MLAGLIHGQPLQLGLLAASHDVDVVAAPHTMVEDAEQAIAIGWIVHPDGFFPAGECIVDEAGRLMTESIVIVAPCVAGQEHVQGCEGLRQGKSRHCSSHLACCVSMESTTCAKAS